MANTRTGNSNLIRTERCMMSKKKTTVTVPLDYPVEVDGKTYSSLTLRRMKAKDALIAEGEKNEARAGYLMFAALAEVDIEVIEELDVDDLEHLSEKAAPLMGKSASKKLAEMADKPSAGET